MCLGPPVHELPARGQGAVREQRGGEVPYQTAPPATTPARQRGNQIKSSLFTLRIFQNDSGVFTV